MDSLIRGERISQAHQTMKTPTTLVIVCLILWFASCKHSKNLVQHEATNIISTSQVAKDSICQELKEHLETYWSYNEDGLFVYTSSKLPSYINCIRTTNDAISLLGSPSAMYYGYMFYDTGCFCLSLAKSDSGYQKCKSDARHLGVFSCWKIRYSKDGKVKKIYYERAKYTP